jgi:hypothetical protein
VAELFDSGGVERVEELWGGREGVEVTSSGNSLRSGVPWNNEALLMCEADGTLGVPGSDMSLRLDIPCDSKGLVVVCDVRWAVVGVASTDDGIDVDAGVAMLIAVFIGEQYVALVCMRIPTPRTTRAATLGMPTSWAKVTRREMRSSHHRGAYVVSLIVTGT